MANKKKVKTKTKSENGKIIININTGSTDKSKEKSKDKKSKKKRGGKGGSINYVGGNKKYKNPLYNPQATPYYTGTSSIPISSANIPDAPTRTNKSEYKTESIINPKPTTAVLAITNGDDNDAPPKTPPKTPLRTPIKKTRRPKEKRLKTGNMIIDKLPKAEIYQILKTNGIPGIKISDSTNTMLKTYVEYRKQRKPNEQNDQSEPIVEEPEDLYKSNLASREDDHYQDPNETPKSALLIEAQNPNDTQATGFIGDHLRFIEPPIATPRTFRKPKQVLPSPIVNIDQTFKAKTGASITSISNAMKRAFSPATTRSKAKVQSFNEDSVNKKLAPFEEDGDDEGDK